MRTVDHFMLGKYLIKTIRNYVSIPVFCRASFVFGNIEPDLNFITFFKKGNEGKVMCGHNFKNGSECIKKLLEDSVKRKDSVLAYYKMGKIMHYVADCFTFPHNEGFCGDLKEHMEYEHRLHKKFTVIISRLINNEADNMKRKKPERDISVDISKERICNFFNVAHERYIAQRKCDEDDIKNIITMTYAMFSLIYAAEARGIERRGYKIKEKPVFSIKRNKVTL